MKYGYIALVAAAALSTTSNCKADIPSLGFCAKISLNCNTNDGYSHYVQCLVVEKALWGLCKTMTGGVGMSDAAAKAIEDACQKDPSSTACQTEINKDIGNEINFGDLSRLNVDTLKQQIEAEVTSEIKSAK